MDDQEEYSYNCSVWIQGVDSLTSRERWMIVTIGEKEPGKSELASRVDNDDGNVDDEDNVFILGREEWSQQFKSIRTVNSESALL